MSKIATNPVQNVTGDLPVNGTASPETSANPARALPTWNRRQSSLRGLHCLTPCAVKSHTTRKTLFRQPRRQERLAKREADPTLS